MDPVSGGKTHEVDARPSDAVTLSLRMKAPIFVMPQVLESNQYLVTADAIVSGLDESIAEALQKTGQSRKLKWSGDRFVLCQEAEVVG